MGAVDEIRAAIESLERLKEQSAPAPWEGWKQYNPLRGEVYGVEANGEEVAKTYSLADTELIEVLHRTIDPQLAILRRAMGVLDLSFGHAESAVERECALARAINGGA